MALTVREATAVNQVLDALYGPHRITGRPVPTEAEFVEALADLADGAYRRLMAGRRGDHVRDEGMTWSIVVEQEEMVRES